MPLLASVAEFVGEDNASAHSSSSAETNFSLPSKSVGLKRSPYLSQMTQNVDTDLMAALSRPGKDGTKVLGEGGAREVASVGGGDFFSLRRPPPAAANRNNRSEGSGPRPRPSFTHLIPGHAMPSALRGGNSSSALHSGEGGGGAGASSELKKNASVTFSQSTKKGSVMGMQHEAAEAVLSTVILMANAQHDAEQANPSTYSEQQTVTRSSSFNNEQQQGKNQFPFYFDTLSSSHAVPPSPNPMQDGTSSSSSREGHQRTKSKSTNTLQYYYKPLLKTTNLDLTISPSTPAFSQKLRNLTFREMLDEGDGKEGDMNVRLRNEQWKVFRSNSCTVSDDEGDANTNNGNSVSGVKRVLTPSSSGGSASDGGGSSNIARGYQDTGGHQMMDHPQNNTPMMQHSLIGAHRGCVSAHDLAVLRRSASKMKMTAAGGTAWAGVLPSVQSTIQSPQRPGETLGASMLSRLSSIESSGTSLGDSNTSATVGGSNNGPAVMSSTSNATSPLAQMMAKKFNMRMMPDNGQSSMRSTTNLMGRRVHTVSAGLAYGSAGFCMDSNTRLSRFELLSGKMGGDGGGTSTLSIASGASGGGGGYGKNEEWS
ncbi:hypothetical protein ACHAXN_005547 [Cyclotella atomus]